MIKEINKSNSWFFEKINKIDNVNKQVSLLPTMLWKDQVLRQWSQEKRLYCGAAKQGDRRQCYDLSS